MYVVLAGGGKVGRSIAEDMLEEGHDVAIIERVHGRCDQLLRDYDVLVIEGDACDVRQLAQAKPERANVFVATTGDDDDNFVACQLAKVSFGVPRVIARVNTPRNEEIFRHLDIEAVSTTTLISRLIREQLSVGELIHLYTLRAGTVNLVEIDIPPDAPAHKTRLTDLPLPEDATLVCIFRGEETIIPRGVTRLRPGDQVIALTKPEAEASLREVVLTGKAPAGEGSVG